MATSIAIVGNLCNLGYQFAEGFSELGLHAKLIATPADVAMISRQIQDDIDWQVIHRVTGSRWLRDANIYRALTAYDTVLTVGLGGLRPLSIYQRPYSAYATGSDLRELAMGLGEFRRIDPPLARRAFRRARTLFYSPDRGHTAALAKLGITRGIPWRQIVDTDFWAAEPSPYSGQLHIFTSTAQQWIPQFHGQWLKSNDILFRGFARFIAAGGSGTLTYIAHGQDVVATDELVSTLGIRDVVEAVPGPISPLRLRDLIRSATVVADQFSVGAFGLSALQALSAGRPLITYLDADMLRKTYGEDQMPPTRSVSTPEDVAELLHHLNNARTLARESQDSSRWLHAAHDRENLLRWYLGKMGVAVPKITHTSR